MSDEQTALPSAARKLSDILGGYELGSLIHTALCLGLFERLALHSADASALAGEYQLDPVTFTSFLRFLAAEEVLDEQSPGTFGLGPIGQRLTPEAGGEWVLFNQDAFRGIERTLKSGKEANDQRLFAYLGSHPYAEAAYQRTIAALDSGGDEAIAAVYRLDRERVIDLGGGQGGLLAAILHRYPNVTGVLVDRRAALDGARSRFTADKLLDRVELVEGDFFGRIPQDGDIYIIKWTIADLNDEETLRVFENCRSHMPVGARLHIIEMLHHGDAEPIASIIDLNVRALAGGQVRDEARIQALLGQAGFVAGQPAVAAGHFTIIEGVKWSL